MTQFVQQIPSNDFAATSWTMICLDIVMHMTNSAENSNSITAHIAQHTESSSFQTLGMSDYIIQEKETQPPKASFSVSVYCSFE